MRARSASSSKSPQSKYRGVCWAKHFGKCIKVGRRDVKLGYFEVEKDAAIARDRVVLAVFGNNKATDDVMEQLLNFPKQRHHFEPITVEGLRRERREQVKETMSSSLRRCVVRRGAKEVGAAVAHDRAALFFADRETLRREGRLNFPRRRHLVAASIDEVRRQSRALVKQRMTSRYRGVSWCNGSKQ